MTFFVDIIHNNIIDQWINNGWLRHSEQINILSRFHEVLIMFLIIPDVLYLLYNFFSMLYYCRANTYMKMCKLYEKK